VQARSVEVVEASEDAWSCEMKMDFVHGRGSARTSIATPFQESRDWKMRKTAEGTIRIGLEREPTLHTTRMHSEQWLGIGLDIEVANHTQKGDRRGHKLLDKVKRPQTA
jgi:hypothetical protein